MQNVSRTLLLLCTLSLTLSCISAASLPSNTLTEEETVHTYLANGGHELIQKALDLPEGVYYNPLTHFTRDDAPLPKSRSLSRQLNYSIPSDIQLLRSLGYYLPGLDDDSLMHNGHLHRMHSVSRQRGDSGTIRGQKSVFSIVYQGGPPDPARTAFEYALQIWADTFECSIVLRVLFKWENMGGRTLAAANSPFTVLRRRSSSKLQSNTAYTPTMAAAVSGVDYVPAKHHIEISFNSRQAWHYDLGSRAPIDMFDLATVALHEQCHGLFFSGALLGKTVTGRAEFVSARETPGRFDQFMQTSTGIGIARSCNSRELFQAITTPGLRFRTTSGNSTFGLYAPTTYQPGSSTYHFDGRRLRRDCDMFEIPISECSDLMTFELDTGYTRRTIGEPALRVMRSVIGQNAGLKKSDVCDVPPATHSGSSSRPGLFDSSEPVKPFSLPSWVIITVASVGALGAIIVLYFNATAFVKH